MMKCAVDDSSASPFRRWGRTQTAAKMSPQPSRTLASGAVPSAVRRESRRGGGSEELIARPQGGREPWCIRGGGRSPQDPLPRITGVPGGTDRRSGGPAVGLSGGGAGAPGRRGHEATDTVHMALPLTGGVKEATDAQKASAPSLGGGGGGIEGARLLTHCPGSSAKGSVESDRSVQFVTL